MYYIRDSYVGRAFTWTPVSIVWGIFLFLAANLYGQLLFGLGEALPASLGLSDHYEMVFYGFIPFALAALSFVGIIFILADVWLLYELLYEEGVASRFFFWVAANQIGICVCATIPIGGFFYSLIPGILALIMLKLIAWTLRWFGWARWKIFG